MEASIFLFQLINIYWFLLSCIITILYNRIHRLYNKKVQKDAVGFFILFSRLILCVIWEWKKGHWLSLWILNSGVYMFRNWHTTDRYDVGIWLMTCEVTCWIMSLIIIRRLMVVPWWWRKRLVGEYFRMLFWTCDFVEENWLLGFVKRVVAVGVCY